MKKISKGIKKSKKIEVKVEVDGVEDQEIGNCVVGNSLKVKKKSSGLGKKKKKKKKNLKTCKIEVVEEVSRISRVDDDCSKGMKKWLNVYHKSRPGLNILQQRIDDFIINHEVEEEKAKKEREAQAAEGGWTVVTHQKGRKKTTDSESGITVGSVSLVAVENMTAKKKKEIPLDFYRFHKREAHRNEFMMLQSRFEQDKKRIQQLRAARKFRPY